MRAIFITGTPGVGKTAVARRVAERLGVRAVALDALARRHRLLRGYDRSRGSLTVNLRRLSSVVEETIQREVGGVIFEGHYLPNLPKRSVRHVFVLRCHPLEVARRLEARGFSRRKAVENAWAEALDYCLIEAVAMYGESKVHEIDTTSSMENHTVELILRILRGEAKAPPPRFDWLSQMKSAGQLERFMKTIS